MTKAVLINDTKAISISIYSLLYLILRPELNTEYWIQSPQVIQQNTPTNSNKVAASILPGGCDKLAVPTDS